MITEKEIETSFAEAVLVIIKNPAHETNVDTFCHEYHLDHPRNRIIVSLLINYSKC